MLLLQAATGAPGAGYINLLFIGAMFLIMYLFMIRPQAKKQREQVAFAKSLTKNDEVVTNSGLLGRISKIEDDIITLEVGTKVYVRVLRNAISKDLTDSVYGAGKKSPVVTQE
ncbi:MAG: preprotein translocase subunit YajC [Haliscomenobacter sp.]|nr:preprotein translocase subunit YajC [Haliscomenobacter sp.]MBK9490217.1 preprotein translocase subunit YajC [Haliscomenobacter sp.]